MEREVTGGEVKTGLFVLAALALLAFSVLWVVGSGLGGSDRRAQVVWLDDAAGIRSGDPVRLSGIEVGRVESVELRPAEDYPVELGITMDADLELRQGASARLSADGLLGSKFLGIEPGPLDAAPLGETPLLGKADGGIEGAMQAMQDLGGDAGGLLVDAREILNELGPRLNTVLERSEALLAEETVAEAGTSMRLLRQTLEEVRSTLPSLMDRLDAITTQAQASLEPVPELTSEARSLVGDLRQALGPDGERLASTLEAAQDALVAAEATLKAAEGTFGVVNDNGDAIGDAIADLRRAAANLQAVSESLKQRPDRLLRPNRKKDRQPGSGGGGNP